MTPRHPFSVRFSPRGRRNRPGPPSVFLLWASEPLPMEDHVMTRIAAYVAAATLLAVQAAPLAVAQTQMVPPLNPAPQTQDGITYVSGGIADDWQQAMESQRGQYNLHLLFAQLGTGAYFANIPVQTMD